MEIESTLKFSVSCLHPARYKNRQDKIRFKVTKQVKRQK